MPKEDYWLPKNYWGAPEQSQQMIRADELDEKESSLQNSALK